MTCRLCHKEATLQQSHVIPEFMYGALYDDKHRFHVLSTDEWKKNIYAQKGIREELLCSACEEQLSKYERYVSLVFSGAIPLSIARDGRLIIIEGLEYSAFKLFALSVLWRAGVSNLPLFKQVQLGPHEEPIRLMVLKGDAGAPEIYGFILAPIMLDGQPEFDAIVQPTRSRLAGHYAYRFVFGGLAWVFMVSSHRPPASIVPALLSKEGKLVMLETELGEMSFIMKMGRELEWKGKLNG
jgi:hypothetical protein